MWVSSTKYLNPVVGISTNFPTLKSRNGGYFDNTIQTHQCFLEYLISDYFLSRTIWLKCLPIDDDCNVKNLFN